MATTVNSDMIIYPTLAQTAYFERVQDVIEIFNASSRGTMVMRSDAIPGDFSKSSFFTVPDAMGHRDVNSDAAALGIKLGSDEDVTVKAPWKFGPIETTEEAYKRQNMSPAMFSQQLGIAQADQMLEYTIEAAFAALDSAIASNAPMDVSGSLATDGRKVITTGLRTMGDRSQRIAMLGMSSATYYDFVDQAIDDKLDGEIAGVLIAGAMPGTLGKPVLVSDKISDNVVYGLQPGAVEMIESQAPGMRVYDIDVQENLAVGYRSEGAFNVGLLGYRYSEVAGANPDNATIGAAGSWIKNAQSDKLTAGFRLTLL